MDAPVIRVLLIEDSIFSVKHTEKMLSEAESLQFHTELKHADQLSSGLDLLKKGGSTSCSWI